MRFASPIPVVILAFLGMLSLALLFAFVPNIAQPQSYHGFADQKPLFKIPNWNNIWSSLLYIPLGIWGWMVARHISYPKERILWQFFSLAIIGIGIGSSLYHLQPNNASLVLDRLPIAIGLMTFLSILIEEEKGGGWGLRFFPFAAAMGIFSVIWWFYKEKLGSGDLRLYLWLHFIVFLATLLFACFRTSMRRWLLIAAAFLFAASKVFEIYDLQIYAHLDHVLGGHPLKHLSSAAAVICIILYCRLRTSFC